MTPAQERFLIECYWAAAQAHSVPRLLDVLGPGHGDGMKDVQHGENEEQADGRKQALAVPFRIENSARGCAGYKGNPGAGHKGERLGGFLPRTEAQGNPDAPPEAAAGTVVEPESINGERLCQGGQRSGDVRGAQGEGAHMADGGVLQAHGEGG